MIRFTLNGRSRPAASSPDTPLLYVLRGEFELNGAKFGCGLGQCGACTVLIDGAPAFSCVTPLAAVAGRDVVTPEGLGTAARPGPVQAAFEAEQAAQCGYCIPGMMVRAHALLARNTRPTEAEVREALQPGLCRCGTHMRILRAVRRAAAAMGGGVRDPAEPAQSARFSVERRG
ncbi:MAG TPA: 2Fe-2S iron-sulfur cluster-binding protein [Caulobacteraceae bacterium]|jgi:aerobic-type carbon monoxide dehydrogenase small subunit (CoxS/CutS family)|nr:2Fe-2S iron-sulfur cluster-binding protein [Caulobacteraceae bacterium]